MITSRIMRSLSVMRTHHLQPMKLVSPLLHKQFLRFQSTQISTQIDKKPHPNHYELYELAKLYEKEIGVFAFNKMKAFQLYKQAADLGHPVAMSRMADYYAEGNSENFIFVYRGLISK